MMIGQIIFLFAGSCKEKSSVTNSKRPFFPDLQLSRGRSLGPLRGRSSILGHLRGLLRRRKGVRGPARRVRYLRGARTKPCERRCRVRRHGANPLPSLSARFGLVTKRGCTLWPCSPDPVTGYARTKDQIFFDSRIPCLIIDASGIVPLLTLPKGKTIEIPKPHINTLPNSSGLHPSHFRARVMGCQ